MGLMEMPIPYLGEADNSCTTIGIDPRTTYSCVGVFKLFMY